MDEIFAELKDRFGALPEPALWLYHSSRIRIFAALHQVAHVKVEKQLLSIQRKKGERLIATQHLIGKIKDPPSLEAKILPFIASP